MISPIKRAAPGGAPNEGEKPIKLGPGIAGLARFAIEQTADGPSTPGLLKLVLTPAPNALGV